MAQRRRFSAEYKREAVVMLEFPGVSISQIATELGIGVTVLGWWRRKIAPGAGSGVCGLGSTAGRGTGQVSSDDHCLTGLWLPMTQQPETISRPNAAHGLKRLPLAVSVFDTAV